MNPSQEAIAAAKELHAENWSAMTYDQMVASGARIIDQHFAQLRTNCATLSAKLMACKDHDNAFEERIEWLGRENAKLLEDKARLDWLEKQRTVLNAHTGSRYGWKLVQSHLVNRLMLPTPEVCEMAGVDLHDTGMTSDDVRAAIDRARNP